MARHFRGVALVGATLWALDTGAQDLGSLDGGVKEVRGTASFRVPIVVPPGPAGHTPDLALVYSSEKHTGGSGWVGLGWRVAAASSIERDRKFGVPFDFESPPCAGSYCYRDDFVLDGVDLTCTQATCNGSFKTQVDDGREITYLGEAAGWRIRDREGRTLLYGESPAARNVNTYHATTAPNGNNQVFAWLLEEVTDASGNRIRFTYAPGVGVKYLQEVSWGQGVTANRRAIFHLDPRPDTAIDYTAGFRQQIDQRLVEIEVRAGAGGGALVTRYDLGYSQSPDSNRSLLGGVQRVGSDESTTLAPWEFEYLTSAHASSLLVFHDTGGSAHPVVRGSDGAWTYRGSVDLNGDGLLDHFHRDQPSTSPELGLGTWWIRNRGLPAPSAPFGLPAYLHGYELWDETSFHVSQSLSGPAYGSSGLSLVVDFDGDGYRDHVLSPLVLSQPASCTWQVNRGSDSGFSDPVSWTNLSPIASAGFNSWCDHFQSVETQTDGTRVALIDMTGDGRPDRVLGSATPSWQVWVNRGFDPQTGAGSFSGLVPWPNPDSTPIDLGYDHRNPILNGDSLPDHLWGSGVAFGFGAGFDEPEPIDGAPAGAPPASSLVYSVQGTTYRDLIDVNGDGFLDRVVYTYLSPRTVWFGTGVGFRETEIAWTGSEGGPLYGPFAETRDYNGDGLVDQAEGTLEMVLVNAGPPPDLLRLAHSPLEGTLEFEYDAAAHQPDEAGVNANPGLPFPRWVVTRTVRSDGRGSPGIVDTYLYRDAAYDRAEREFRGFGEVVHAALGAGGAVEREVVSTYSTDRSCGGRLAARTVRAGVAIYSEEDHTYKPFPPQPEAGVLPHEQWTACLAEESTFTAIEAGTGTARTRQVVRVYGNLLTDFYRLRELREEGDPAQSGDERYTVFEYADASDPGYHVVSKLSEVLVKEAAGTIRSWTRLYYDGGPHGSATRGLLTMIEGRLESEARWVLQAALGYDAFGNVRSRVGAPEQEYDPDGFAEVTTFDPVYQTFPIGHSRGADTEEALVTTIDYAACLDGISPPPALGLPCLVTNPQGVQDRFQYDPLGRLSSQLRPSGLREFVTYTFPAPAGPAETEIEQVLDFDSPSTPSLTLRAFVDGLGRTYREESPGEADQTVAVSREFDARGRVAFETQPHFTTTANPPERSIEYDPLGRTASILDFDGETERAWTYLPWEVVEEAYFQGARKHHERSSFDGLGRVRRVRSYPDAVGLTVSFEIAALYDAADRLAEVRDPVAASGAPSDFCDSHQMGAQCAGQDHTTFISWDTLGRKREVNDPDAGVWTYQYFDSGLLSSQMNPNGGVLEYSYDHLERPVSQLVTPKGNGSVDATFAYGETAGADYGRLTGVDALPDPLGESTSADYTFEYDDAGRLAAERVVLNGLIFDNDYSYDELDRLQTRTFPEGSTFTYTYDGLRLVRIAGPSARRPLEHATYDALGRPTELQIGGRVIGGTSVPSASLQYEFADSGARLSRILARRHPAASSSEVVMDLHLGFDGLGQLESQGGSFQGSAIVPRSFLYDGLGRLKQAIGPWESPGSSAMWALNYDPLGNLRTQSSQSGSSARVWSYGHPDRPRFLSAFLEFGIPEQVADTNTADPAGNLLTRARSGGGGPGPTSPAQFVWNAQNRLYSMSYSPGSPLFRIDYDAFGRRIVNWAHSIYFATEDFEYDASANQANFYFFVGGQRIASYARFGDHYSARWVPLWLVGDVERWAPRAALVVLLFGAIGVVVLAGRRRRPAWLARAGVGFLGGVMVLWPLRALPTGGGGGPSTYGGHGEENGVFYVSDHLGSTRAVINVAGSVVETRDYDPFGRDIAHTGDFQLKHRYTGQPVTESDWESVAPLYDYGARFYDPRWGRFLSPDTFVERLSSQGMNRYAYVGNQPTSRIDPTGHFGDGGGLGGIGGLSSTGPLSGSGDGPGLNGLTAVATFGFPYDDAPWQNWGWEEDDTWGLGQISAVIDVFGGIFGDGGEEGGGNPRTIFGDAWRIAQLLGPTRVGREGQAGSGPQRSVPAPAGDLNLPPGTVLSDHPVIRAQEEAMIRGMNAQVEEDVRELVSAVREKETLQFQLDNGWLVRPTSPSLVHDHVVGLETTRQMLRAIGRVELAQRRLVATLSHRARIIGEISSINRRAQTVP